MTAVYELAYNELNDGSHVDDRWFSRPQIFELILSNQEEDDRLQWFANLKERADSTRAGMLIQKFEGRVLSGIKMQPRRN
jgi:hypothetical protein